MIAFLILVALGVFAMLSSAFRITRPLIPVSVAGLVLAIVCNSLEWGTAKVYFGMARFDNTALLFGGLAMCLCLMAMLFLRSAPHLDAFSRGDSAALVFFSLSGGMLLLSFLHLAVLFLGIELMSLPLYVLAGSEKNSQGSNEATIKYFLMGSFASALLLFGMALIYAATGHFDVPGIALAVEGGSASAALVGGFLLGTVGLLFKAGVFPFHLWVPDVYDGSPTWVTSLMASAVKVFAFAALARFVFALGADLDELLAVLSVATMSLGNILAFRQTDVKRMLAYSSVAHAGFLLLILLMQNGLWPTLFYYAMAYSLASLTAFSVLIFAPNIDGLSRRQGLLAGSFAVALISLSGLPPTAGFFAKFILLAGMFDGGHWILAILALANALLSLGYYFRLLPRLFAQTKSEPIEVPFAAKLAFSILTVATVLGGVFFGWVLILAGS